MKLQTSIKPRRDGVVTVVGEDGLNYQFKPDADGALVCDVEHESTLAKLLTLEHFEPVDTADYEKAILISQAAKPPAGADDEDLDDPENPDALPIEANTPPAPAKAKPGPKPKAK